ncbi:NADH-quinone oxidoreductase subunit L [Casimicrobium huifangae]|uniref:NADH-quinone oxidoreductase subunit L n=1 Tax=Casimicrobium huifangae TaxID=2591109 RepID=UPI0012EB6E49|nr:NADH-quinone oxidoreductase subunit L [Casimicrobium huifangae]
MKLSYLIVPFAPLIGAILAGLWGRQIGRKGAHTVTILGVLISFIASCVVFADVLAGNTFNGPLYTWMVSGGVKFEVGFLIDTLTVTMMLVVTSVSLMVHIYTIGYMEEDPGYQRFFSYISLFTFSMLMLVMSNNFLQLFFGWEAVGLVSYLLIGFWYTRPTAIFANMKAFLVNRVGDLGFLLGIGLVLAYTGSLDYATVFKNAPSLANISVNLGPVGIPSWATATCILLFIGAMGKSAQVPLHVWLPDSMEGPTPISALIHAATMVTAGIFMVSRMSPLFEMSTTALSFVLIIGATTALFMGFLGIIQYDIKRVVAYSTLSQLGYMTVALGVSAYSAAMFHLVTHAFFKALLFLAAGSVIIGMHHNQDIRYMGGIRKYMKITWLTSLVGSLALIGFPLLSGFYSKDTIIEAVHESKIFGHGYANFAVLCGVFVTAFYSFRMYFLVFHGKERYDEAPHDDHHHHDDHGHGHDAKPHESPWVVTLPLVLLAIPSVILGYFGIDKIVYGDWFKGAIAPIAQGHDTLGPLKAEFHGAMSMAIHGLTSLPFILAMAGVALAYYLYVVNPALPARLRKQFSGIVTVLEEKYYFDRFNEFFFAGGARKLGEGLFRFGDRAVIDGALVNGSAKGIGLIAGLMRHLQTGFIYHYAFVMVAGVLAFLTWLLLR